MVYDRLIRDVYQNGIAEGIEKDRMELKDKALELFNNGEIDNKLYEYLVEFLDTKE